MDPDSLEACRAQALDPHTAPETLYGLLGTCPEEVLANPTFLLLTVENPALWRTLYRSGHDLRQVFASPHCPRALLDAALAGDSLVLERYGPLVWRSPQLTVEQRRTVFFKQRKPPKDLDAEAPHLGADLVDLLKRALRSRRFMQKPPSVTPDELESLAAMGWMGRELAISVPGCPHEVLRAAARDICPAFDKPLASNPTAPADVQRVVMNHSTAWTALAGNPGLVPDVARSLLKLGRAAPLMALTQNPPRRPTCCRPWPRARTAASGCPWRSARGSRRTTR